MRYGAAESSWRARRRSGAQSEDSQPLHTWSERRCYWLNERRHGRTDTYSPCEGAHAQTTRPRVTQILAVLHLASNRHRSCRLPQSCRPRHPRLLRAPARPLRARTRMSQRRVRVSLAPAKTREVAIPMPLAQTTPGWVNRAVAQLRMTPPLAAAPRAAAC
jgi:hypothetical protein